MKSKTDTLTTDQLSNHLARFEAWRAEFSRTGYAPSAYLEWMARKAVGTLERREAERIGELLAPMYAENDSQALSDWAGTSSGGITPEQRTELLAIFSLRYALAAHGSGALVSWRDLWDRENSPLAEDTRDTWRDAHKLARADVRAYLRGQCAYTVRGPGAWLTTERMEAVPSGGAGASDLLKATLAELLRIGRLRLESSVKRADARQRYAALLLHAVEILQGEGLQSLQASPTGKNLLGNGKRVADVLKDFSKNTRKALGPDFADGSLFRSIFAAQLEASQFSDVEPELPFGSLANGLGGIVAKPAQFELSRSSGAPRLGKWYQRAGGGRVVYFEPQGMRSRSVHVYDQPALSSPEPAEPKPARPVSVAPAESKGWGTVAVRRGGRVLFVQDGQQREGDKTIAEPIAAR